MLGRRLCRLCNSFRGSIIIIQLNPCDLGLCLLICLKLIKRRVTPTIKYETGFPL